MKKYKCGLYVGRFQPLHVGHTSIISKMFDECEVVIVAVGSAQESGTVRNPFDFATRSRWIAETFSGRKNHILHIVRLYRLSFYIVVIIFRAILNTVKDLAQGL